MYYAEFDDVKQFMGNLLSDSDPMFHSLLLVRMKVKTAVYLEVDGKIHPEFYDRKEEVPIEKYISWKEAKPLFIQAIRGKTLPLEFQIVLMIPEEAYADFIPGHEEKAGSLTLTVIYDREKLSLRSGIFLKQFTLDKIVEELFEANLKKRIKEL